MNDAGPFPVTRSLKRKLLLPLLLIGAVIAAATVWSIYAAFEQQIGDRVRSRAELVANSVNYAAESVSRPGELQRIVTAIGAEEEVELIVVVGGRPARVLASTRTAWLGRTLAELPIKDVAEDLERVIQTRQSQARLHLDAAVFDFASPLLLSQRELADRSLVDGAVMVHLDRRATQAAMRQLTLRFSVASLVALAILSTFGYGLIRHTVLRPIARIGALIEQRHEGRTEGWTETATGDEIGALARTLKDSLTRTDATLYQLEDQAKQLREAEARYRLLFEQSPDGIVILDTQTARPVEFNEAAHRQLGYSREEFARLSVSDFEVVETPEETAAHIAHVVREGRDDFETRHRTRQGDIRNIHATVQVIEVLGQPVYHCIYRDITERVQAEDDKAALEIQLLQAQKMESIGRLAGGVAHDFNNMLGVILGHADLALDHVDPAHPLTAEIQEIRKAATRSADLTRQLLAFARKQAIAPKVLDLNETVGNMLLMLRRLIGEHIDLTWQPGVDLWSVKVDPSQIDQIIANLCVNARDAISGVGNVTIETGNRTIDEGYCANHIEGVPGEYVRLAVSDNGSGMDRDTLARLFEPFFTTKEFGKGSGLGLASVHGAVKQNRGFTNVSSEPNHGTTFEIYLPRHADQTAQIPVRAPAIPSHLGRETILLVEDELAILTLTKRLLERRGYTVLATNTPGDALRVAKEHAGEIHLLVTDVVMPGMNGRAVANELLSFSPRLRCLFMSGYTADVIADHHGPDSGVQFIQKPFSAQDLASKVRQALDAQH